MSKMYELLEETLDSYQNERSEAVVAIFVEAAQMLDDAFESESLEALLKKLRKAALTVRQLDDEAVSFLFDFHLANELIGTAHRAHEGIEVLKPAAIATRDDSYADSPLRVAINNMLATAYSMIDPAGYAVETRLIYDLVDSSLVADEEDRLLALGNRYEAEVARGEFAQAKETRDQMWLQADLIDDPDYYMLVATFDCDVAFNGQDWHGLLAAVEHVWKLTKDVDEDDTNRQAVLAANALALAKLGRKSLAASNVQTRNPFPERPAGLPFYHYWCHYHLEVGQPQLAANLAKQGFKEMRGSGQDYLEAQILCLWVQSLAASGDTTELQEKIAMAEVAIDRLQDPSPMKQKLAQAAVQH